VQWLRDPTRDHPASFRGRCAGAQRRLVARRGVLPALTGLGRAALGSRRARLITGLTRGSFGAHLARATLEGIAFQIAELGKQMAQDAKKPLRRLRVDGGASMNALLMQFQATCWTSRSDRPSCVETTALGAA